MDERLERIRFWGDHAMWLVQLTANTCPPDASSLATQTSAHLDAEACKPSAVATGNVIFSPCSSGNQKLRGGAPGVISALSHPVVHCVPTTALEDRETLVSGGVIHPPLTQRPNERKFMKRCVTSHFREDAPPKGDSLSKIDHQSVARRRDTGAK